MDNLISIIIPTYNKSIYLKKCIDSIMKQTIDNYEIIVVDDGTNEEIIKSYNSSKINYIKKNKGISYARNIGLKSAKGKYITFVDSDDEISTKHLEILLNGLTNDVEMSFVSYCRKKKNSYNSKQKKINNHIAYELILNKNFGGYVWNKLFLKKIIDDNKLKFDEKISVGEDFLFVCEYLKYIKNVNVNYNKSYFYRKHKKQITKKYDERLVTVLDSWKKIESIYKNFCPSKVNEIKYRYYKKAIELNLLNEKIEYRGISFKRKIIIIFYKLFRKQIIFIKKGF